MILVIGLLVGLFIESLAGAEAGAEADTSACEWIQEVRESVDEDREKNKCGIKQSQSSYYIQRRTKSSSDLMLCCQV